MQCEILLIDDDDLFGYLIKRRYSKLNISINQTSNYNETIEILNKTNPSFILLDMNLIGYEGIEFYQKLINTRKTIPKTYIISSMQPPDSVWEPYKNLSLEFMSKDRLNKLSQDEILNLIQ